MNTKIDTFTRQHCMNWCKHQFRNWEVPLGAMLFWLEQQTQGEADAALERGWPSVWRIVSMERPDVFEASFD